ncbi:hypothetical protein [Clostridium magnum]|uniref:Uncharacterized protein n=1 Tax=Clostridium magnum DSM 2767 TaxID=1121326 RepID=A0A162SPH5_9CLOT|nr:hypothetical protein [Clostridium magnum]KZL91699.1 hypothetical protein CLMAG_34580 [Clostridium magnum DSM 2767]SHJ39607.1 hypothetical protein SAMN02745944_05891 [Clostridium magnum DSM 2767]
MILSLKDSETWGYLARDRSIQITKNMFEAGMNIEEILYYNTELLEEFIQEVLNKVKKEI